MDKDFSRVLAGTPLAALEFRKPAAQIVVRAPPRGQLSGGARARGFAQRYERESSPGPHGLAAQIFTRAPLFAIRAAGNSPCRARICAALLRSPRFVRRDAAVRGPRTAGRRAGEGFVRQPGRCSRTCFRAKATSPSFRAKASEPDTFTKAASRYEGHEGADLIESNRFGA